MTQPSANILLRIEQLLSAGKQQEAQLLLVEYIKTDPASARAWWLLSLTLTDIRQQMDCLQRVLYLDPQNEPARERLVKLISQPSVSTPMSSFASLSPADKEEPPGRAPSTSARVAPPGVETETVRPQSAKQQVTSSTVPPAPIEPAEKAPLTHKPNAKRGIVYILMIGFTICVIALIALYLSIQRKAQAQAHILQETFAVAQTLTSLPLPTLIPTWTASPTITALPSATFTGTPTLTPTIQSTDTRTPRPSGLIGPEEGLYAPDFSLTDLATGHRVTLNQFDGQPVLIFFWATWCSKCNNEIGSIETITQTYKDTGLVVLTINAGEDYATLSIYRNAHQLTFYILLDSDSAVRAAYQVNKDSIPRHFFIDSSGRITFIGRGEMTLDELKIQVAAIMQPYPTSTP